MKNDEFLPHTSSGAFVLELFHCLEKSTSRHTAIEICSQIESCLPPKGENLSTGSDKVWSKFHKLRLCPILRECWKEYLRTSRVPTHLLKYSDQSLQVMLDRVLKYMIKQRSTTAAGPTKDDDIKLSEREENVVRYMSGYVAVKLLKKYRRKSSSATLINKKKWKYFVSVLEKMKCESQPLCDDTFEDYSRSWSEHIDRGGLFHVKSEVRE